MGICDLSTALDGDALLRRADEALYWAKAFGRDAALVWSARTATRIAAAREDVYSAVDEHAHARRLAGDGARRATGTRARQARLHQAARLHDLGKVALPAGLLARPGALSDPELEHVRQHARSARRSPGLDEEQRAWIRHHHERWDGGGYPSALSPTTIPEGAQLLAIADAWDTIVSGRPYRAALAVDAALAEIDRSAGTHLRPDAGELIRGALDWLRDRVSGVTRGDLHAA